MNARALVLNVIFRKLGCLKLWWLGAFIAPNHQGSRWEAAGDGRTGQSGAPPDTHYSVSGAPPRHPTVRVLEQLIVAALVFLWHRTVWWCTGQSGAPLTRCSDFYRALCCTVHAFRVDRCVARWIAIARWHTEQSGSAPDSPMNYSGARPSFPESDWLDPVRSWCTGHCPVRQTTSHSVIVDFAIHDPHPPGHNPHAHVLLTMRAMDEHGKWLSKSRKVYVYLIQGKWFPP